MENAIKNGKRPSEKRFAAAGNGYARQQTLSDGLLPPPVAENALFFRTAAARYASPNAFAQPKPPKKARFRQFSAFY